MEVETPVLSPIAGGANARPFITHHNAQDIDMYMRIATELHLKRLIVGGLERVYEVGRIFRNEGMDTKHNPEFTTCELYQAYTNLDGMMDILEGILTGAAKEILGTYHVQWLGHDIDLTPSWQRVTMADAVKNVTGADFMACIGDADKGVELAKSVGVDMDGVAHTWGNALYETFDQKVEETLVQPTFITMYPVEVSPLAKRSPVQPELTERYEMFICGCEMGNAFSELNDPIDQKQRFQKQVELRAGGDEEAGMMDEDYINDYTYREEGTVFPLTVPEGEVFLMGDNRNHSNDSRDSSLGTVDTRLLIGKAVFLVFPGRDYLTEQREFGRIGLLQ